MPKKKILSQPSEESITYLLFKCKGCYTTTRKFFTSKYLFRSLKHRIFQNFSVLTFQGRLQGPRGITTSYPQQGNKIKLYGVYLREGPAIVHLYKIMLPEFMDKKYSLYQKFKQNEWNVYNSPNSLILWATRRIACERNYWFSPLPLFSMELTITCGLL